MLKMEPKMVKVDKATGKVTTLRKKRTAIRAGEQLFLDYGRSYWVGDKSEVQVPNA
jgi:hypothetical protein